ncbi:MAG: hypothetical protein ACLP5V_10725 [Candidatus Bathyarchaeia archaeon]
MVWSEFQLWYSETVPTIDALYETRRQLLTILEKKQITDFLILNEPKYLLLRVETDDQNRNEIREALADLVGQSQGRFARVAVDNWSPEDDARTRILNAARALGLQLQDGTGWKIAGREPLNKLWVPTDDDLNTKIREFTIFMTKVVGQFTKAYVDQMPRRMTDRWLGSVMTHLLLNSISVNNYEEEEIRSFPYV